ncbi:hypothetical protein G7B40_000760 [Aetokthonos hydrillicola Thurmond2011]|jgi:hypothetical protein|uniref:Uncharacterized protein n=1 Tax=Aetokthonos hydrillicola Thurmond2011 TaxID=2712845 RepID=A0AAP5I1Q8_9CYAN|nr:Asr1405/Asl0597 family protein [Aetokthonos hydrillicola]MBO3460512.1 hypothetical protein [Aetokthonos hydrillicola CCALA 1050]MBW4588200.1 hypothetical protein [Aetokthonos hydrillicola CCALA 1050]MDR9893116.1 hypothetical protein [Aetokthonos hydrillicola Thurmond2011]
MLQPSSSEVVGEYILQIPLCDRWRIYHRLQELMIPCWCSTDGSLRVRINSSLMAILVRSTLVQFMATRQELIDWLEHCWQLPST